MTNEQLCKAHHDQPRLAANGLKVCSTHQRKTIEAIAALPNLYQMLAEYLTNGSSSATGEFVRSTPTPGLNLNTRVSTARTDILNHLHCWARIGIDEGPWTSSPNDTPLNIATWIVTRNDWYLNQDWTEEFVRESIDLQHTSQRLQQPTTIKRFTVGPCPEPDCTGTLITELRREDDLLPSLIWCDIAQNDPETGKQTHLWTPDKWLTIGRKINAIEDIA